MRCGMRLLLLYAGLLPVLLGVQPVAGAEAYHPPQEYELRLLDALFRGDEPAGADDASLLLLLSRRGGRWERVYGVARDLTARVQVGRVDGPSPEGSEHELTLVMEVKRGGPWDGYLNVEVALERTEAKLYTVTKPDGASMHGVFLTGPSASTARGSSSARLDSGRGAAAVRQAL